MAAPLATCTEEEQRSVIRFFSSEGVKLIEIHRRMKVPYGDACLSLQQVYEWTRKFMNGISSVTDSPRPGQAHRVETPEAIAVVEVIVKENHRITLNEIQRNGDYIEKSSNCVHFMYNKLRDKKYLRFILDSPP